MRTEEARRLELLKTLYLEHYHTLFLYAKAVLQDPALALRVLEVLSRRRREDPRETAAAWQRFEKHYLPAADSVCIQRRRRLRLPGKKGACGPGRCLWPRCWRWRWGCWPCRSAAAIR